MTRAQITRLVALLGTTALALACIGPASKPRPVAPASPAAATQFVLAESYRATMDGVVVHLPYGIYPAHLEDDRGVYYEAPVPIKRKPLLFGNERLVAGGIFVPSSSSQKRLGMLWVYLMGDDGSLETHLLPGEIISGEGRFWRIEPASDGVGYRVQGDCVDGVPDGAYALLLPDGGVQVTGQFVAGKRDGRFTFYRDSGEKVAEVPYTQDRIDGIVELWYGPEHGVDRRKLTADYVDGKPSGLLESWYPDGSLLERSSYVNGVLETTEFYAQNGEMHSDARARERVDAARDADREYFAVLANVVDENLPACASDRAVP